MNIDFKKIIINAGIPTTETELKKQWEDEVKASGYTNANEFSPLWTLLSSLIIKPALLLINGLIHHVLPQSYLKTASGSVIDVMAWAVGLTRKPISRAYGLITFNRNDSNSELSIPAGTIVQSPPIDGVVYQLRTTALTTISIGQTAARVSVEALAPGSQYNLTDGFYSILQNPINGVSVSNQAGWLQTPGADREEDNDLKDRIRNQFSAVNQWHTDAVYTAIISQFAGISPNAIFFEHNAPRGPGTANAFILLDTGNPSAGFLERIQNEITEQGNHGHGDDLRVFAMPSTVHDVHIQIYPRYGLTEDQRISLRNDIEQFIRCAFRENTQYSPTLTQPSKRFSFSKLSQELHREFEYLESVNVQESDITNTSISVPRLRSLSVVIGV